MHVAGVCEIMRSQTTNVCGHVCALKVTTSTLNNETYSTFLISSHGTINVRAKALSLIKEVKSRGQEGRAVQNMFVKLRICVLVLSRTC